MFLACSIHKEVEPVNFEEKKQLSYFITFFFVFNPEKIIFWNLVGSKIPKLFLLAGIYAAKIPPIIIIFARTVFVLNIQKSTDRFVEGAGDDGIVHGRQGEGDNLGGVAGEVAQELVVMDGHVPAQKVTEQWVKKRKTHLIGRFCPEGELGWEFVQFLNF